MLFSNRKNTTILLFSNLFLGIFLPFSNSSDKSRKNFRGCFGITSVKFLYTFCKIGFYNLLVFNYLFFWHSGCFAKNQIIYKHLKSLYYE